ASLQCEIRYSERAVLINLIYIERAIGTLRNAPRQTLARAVFDLDLDGILASAVEQRSAKAAHVEQRHQVLEHRAGPRQEDRSAACRSPPPQGSPVIARNVALRNRGEARQAAFAGKQIVMTREFDRISKRVSHAEQAPPRVVKKAHVDRGCEPASLGTEL